MKETPLGTGAKPLMNVIDTLSISGDELTWTREVTFGSGPLKFSTYQERIK